MITLFFNSPFPHYFVCSCSSCSLSFFLVFLLSSSSSDTYIHSHSTRIQQHNIQLSSYSPVPPVFHLQQLKSKTLH
ncbi:hypothetical protein BKA57DRAFT_459632 [Linnemannia elongata]|nr:hypothetical protein BKA57DRAFT_459632 [Linnemannia elongata]